MNKYGTSDALIPETPLEADDVSFTWPQLTFYHFKMFWLNKLFYQ